MTENEISYQVGIPEDLRKDAAELYEEAFGPKFAVAVRCREARVALIAEAIQVDFGIAAISGGRLIGLAGFHDKNGSLTSGINLEDLKRRLGPFKGIRAALIFSLYRRNSASQELLMDGIAVNSEFRGQGIGYKLLSEMEKLARERRFKSLRLDVVDTNPGARKLYERCGFEATKTESFGYLRWLLGFGSSTTLVKTFESDV